jgi:RimJ/RimL family protein N-acetyltransferase
MSVMDEAEPKIYYDKCGEPFRVINCGLDCYPAILDMYDTYMPEPVAQGLPPARKETRRAWIDALLKNGTNIAAEKEDKIIGHAALIPNPEKRNGEYLIFVARPFQNRGLATVLTLLSIETASNLDLVSVWLTVESDNFRAIKLYRKIGFEFCDRGLSERKMELKIRGRQCP